MSGYIGKANNGLACGVNNPCEINGDEVGEMWKDLGKTFSGEKLTADKGETFKTFTTGENRKEVISDVPSKIKKVKPADESEICECLVLSTKKARHLIDGAILRKRWLVP